MRFVTFYSSEVFLRFYKTDSPHRKTLSLLIKTTLAFRGFKLENIMEQCYDSAGSSLKGSYKGVQALIKE